MKNFPLTITFPAIYSTLVKYANRASYCWNFQLQVCTCPINCLTLPYFQQHKLLLLFASWYQYSNEFKFYKYSKYILIIVCLDLQMPVTGIAIFSFNEGYIRENGCINISQSGIILYLFNKHIWKMKKPKFSNSF